MVHWAYMLKMWLSFILAEKYESFTQPFWFYNEEFMHGMFLPAIGKTYLYMKTPQKDFMIVYWIGCGSVDFETGWT